MLGTNDLVLLAFTSTGTLDTTYGSGGSTVYQLASGFDPWAMAMNGSAHILLVGSKSGKLSVVDVDL